MKASETNFQTLIEGTKQYLVPLFQRPYSWQKKQWQELIDDLNDLYENDDASNHFIGSIVTMPTNSRPENVTPYLLIDGQQRLTTIFVLLILLRDIAQVEGKILADKIQNTLLTNQYHDGLSHYKLMPTQQDRDAFLGLINGQSEIQNNNLLVDCYHFFKKGIKQLDCEKINQVIANRLSVVSIILENDDNPYIVFESLNAKGLSLTQADLIRNYFFMRIDTTEQDQIYKYYWLPMQDTLGEQLTEFMRHYLASDGVIVKKDEVYLVLKKKVDCNKNTLAELNRIKQFSDYYDKIINPEKENNLSIQQNLIRIKRLDFTVLYPFLLNCYFHYETKELTSIEFVEVLKILENFLIRRFICNMPTQGLNKILPTLYINAIKQSPNFVDGLRSYLQSQNYPKDSDFRRSLIESRLYGNGDKQQKTRLILETIEHSFNHKEQPNFDGKVSIEHIMPQTLSKIWQSQLGENWQQDYDLYLNTLGNLTLTAYNPELSNKSFNEKKQLFIQSNFSLNKYFFDIEQWNSEAIEKRADYLADTALKIWQYFGECNQTQNDDGVTGKKPNLLVISGHKFIVKSWSNLFVELLNWIAEYESESFKELAKNYPRFINENPKKLRKTKELKNGFYVETNLSAERIYHFCHQAIQTVGLSNEDWQIEIE